MMANMQLDLGLKRKGIPARDFVTAEGKYERLLMPAN